MKLLRKVKEFLRSLITTVRKTGLSKPEKVLIVFDILYCRARYRIRFDEYSRYRFYQFRDNYRKNFLLAYHQQHKYKKINQKRFTLSKYTFYKRIPECFNREIILLPDCGEEVFVNFVRKYQKVVLKPDEGSCGQGVSPYEYTDDESAKKVYSEIADKMICEQYLCQHPRMNQLCPFTVNTARIQSLRYDDHVEIISCNLRIGGVNSVFVDNMVRGGIGAQVDIQTGTVFTYGHDYYGNSYSHHPRTGVQIIGFQIPNWDRAIELVKKAHLRLPECRLLGWDVAITQDGVELIEANNAPGPTLTQFMDLVPKGRLVFEIIAEEERKKKKQKRACSKR